MQIKKYYIRFQMRKRRGDKDVKSFPSSQYCYCAWGKGGYCLEILRQPRPKCITPCSKTILLFGFNFCDPPGHQGFIIPAFIKVALSLPSSATEKQKAVLGFAELEQHIDINRAGTCRKRRCLALTPP